MRRRALVVVAVLFAAAGAGALVADSMDESGGAHVMSDGSTMPDGAMPPTAP